MRQDSSHKFLSSNPFRRVFILSLHLRRGCMLDYSRRHLRDLTSLISVPTDSLRPVSFWNGTRLWLRFARHRKLQGIPLTSHYVLPACQCTVFISNSMERPIQTGLPACTSHFINQSYCLFRCSNSSYSPISSTQYPDRLQ